MFIVLSVLLLLLLLLVVCLQSLVGKPKPELDPWTAEYSKALQVRLDMARVYGYINAWQVYGEEYHWRLSSAPPVTVEQAESLPGELELATQVYPTRPCRGSPT